MNWLKPFFGERWRKRLLFTVLVYLALLFWPAIVFNQKISFDAPTFTQEWIKSICSVSVLFIILEYQKFTFETIRKRSAGREYLERRIISPLKRVLQLFNDLDSSSSESLNRLALAWSDFYKEILLADTNSLGLTFKDKSLYEFIKEYGLSRVNTEVLGWGIVSGGTQANTIDAIAKLSVLIEAFQKEADTLK